MLFQSWLLMLKKTVLERIILFSIVQVLEKVILVGLIYGHTPHYSEFLYEAVQADPLVIGSFSNVIPKYSPFIEEPCEYLLKVLNKEFKMTEKQLLKLTDTKIIL